MSNAVIATVKFSTGWGIDVIDVRVRGWDVKAAMDAAGEALEAKHGGRRWSGHSELIQMVKEGI